MSAPFFAHEIHQPVWADPSAQLHCAIPELVRNWLNYRESMTVRLQEMTQHRCYIDVLAQRWQAVAVSLQPLLQLQPGRWAWQRTITMRFAGKPLLYAHTLVPPQTISGRHRGLLSLGTTPLGQHLFRQMDVQRQFLQCAALQPQHRGYASAAEALDKTPDKFWARRSLFHLSGQPLLLIETFSPEVFEYE